MLLLCVVPLEALLTVPPLDPLVCPLPLPLPLALPLALALTVPLLLAALGCVVDVACPPRGGPAEMRAWFLR